MRVTSLLAASLVLLCTAGCRSSWKRDGSFEPRLEAPAIGRACTSVECGTAPTVGRVMPGDTLVGELKPEQGCQCFFFEGVEYTLLDFDFTAEGCGEAPSLSVEDPEGVPVELEATTKGGSTTARGLVLRKTGTYKGTICKAAGESEVLYRFAYTLRLAGQDDQRFFLTPASKEAVSFVATRGANCMLTLRPEHACGCVPMVVTVKGPDGTRALAVENQIEGAPPARVTLERDNVRTLRFFAAKPGRYTVTVASEDGTEGDCLAHVNVVPAVSPGRRLFHDNHDCPEGGGCPPSSVASLR